MKYLANQNGKLWHVDNLVMTFITELYEVTSGCIFAICNGKTWKHIKEKV